MNVNVGFVDESKIGQEDLCVTLTVGESTVGLDIDRLDNLIKQLAAVRVAFHPTQSGARPINPSEVHLYETDPTLALTGPEPGQPPQMYMHHAGYGWVPFRISEAWIERLNAAYAQASAQNSASLQ